MMSTSRDYSVLPWTDYFDRSEVVSCSGNKFNTYIKGDEGPIVVFLHGGGFSGLSWSLLTSILLDSINCICLAIDLRGHGHTKTADDSKMDVETLSNDVCDVIKTWNTSGKGVILVGHSLGGSVAIHTALKLQQQQARVLGIVVVDVVEGTALEALRSMNMILEARPATFKGTKAAIEWCCGSGYIRNLSSARVSMIGQLVRKENTSDLSNCPGSGISEESNSMEEKKEKSTEQTSEEPEYKWRIDLRETSKYWRGWFEGLSSKFLSVAAPKLLLLAGVDRLDKDLTVGQMQGKFQLKVLPRAGHAVHEDAPEQVADTLRQFFTRHQMVKTKQ